MLHHAKTEARKLNMKKCSRKRVVNVGKGVREEHKYCHQCGGKGKDRVIYCKKCGSKRYCVNCMTKWYPDVSEEEFAKACPVCQNNCNCNTCLQGFLPEVMQGNSCSKPDKLQYSKLLLQKVFPLLKNLNEESQNEKELEAMIKDIRSYLFCSDYCGANFFGFCRSCTCGYDLCLVCCHKLRDGHLQWRCRLDGTIPCLPKDLGGCGKGTFELKPIKHVENVKQMLKRAQEMYEDNGSGDILETSTRFCMCYDGMQEKSNARFLYPPSAKDIQGRDVKHFQFHWSKGEPIIVSDVLLNSSGLSWEPMVFFRDFSDITKSGERCAYKVNAVDCSNGKEVSVYLHKFLRRYSEGGFNRKEGLTLLKLENWQPPCLSHGKWPRHFTEFIRYLPFIEYTHPHSGYLNVASMLPAVFSELDMGPRMDIAYGVEEELEYGNSVTKLHYDKSDTEGLSANINQQRVTGSMVEGALWDIFRRQDISKLKKYLRNHLADFKLADCPSAEKGFYPIHDRKIYLNMEHKRKLKKEFGIEPWTFKQKLGDAVFIPAGCPYQVRNLKSCTKVELNFISPESLGACIRLQKELCVLPKNHKARKQMQNIGKMMIHALKRALVDLSSNGPINDLRFPNVPEFLNGAGAKTDNYNHHWLEDNETEAITGDELNQEKFPNEVITISSSSMSKSSMQSSTSQNESPPFQTTDYVVDQKAASFKDFKKTEGMYRGNDVGVEAKKLLQAMELHYPKMYKWDQISKTPFWPDILKYLCTVIKGIFETSVEELVDEEQIITLEELLSGLKPIGFDVLWIEKRLHMVKELKFGNDPLSPELMVLQESVESLKEKMDERQKQSMKAHELLIKAQIEYEKARIEYEKGKKARNKVSEMKQKYRDLVLTGPLYSGMLRGY
uniref:lysine-specific demethylase JMJ25-like n=1 Tax=Erigeron canadensis TaxID=72917 RepID=UPI001CB8EEC1|nr:lysine-specific demethylase JMJ25-like [Erigeron canadensis]